MFLVALLSLRQDAQSELPLCPRFVPEKPRDPAIFG
jgi:hypothetical protein